MNGGLIIAAIVVFVIWAGMVHPNRVIERIAMKALETYQLELKAGIKP